MKNLAWIEGRICDIGEANVPLEDRGYLFGDGVYEVIKVYNKKPFYLFSHLRRLQKSAALIDIELPTKIEEIESIITDLVEVGDAREGYIYIQVTRGCAERDHLFPATIKPSMVMYTRLFDYPQAMDLKKVKPIDCITMPDERWLNCHIKSINLLPNVVARQRAHRAGAQEVLFYRPGGVVTEGTRSNIFAVIDGKVRTHPESRLILSGITRGIVVDILRKHNMPFLEEEFYVEDLGNVSEAWTTSTVMEVKPVTSIGKIRLFEKEPGPLYRFIVEEFWKIVQKECYNL